ncbi:hypothetical protein CRUP_020730 [Coryphaenoides rupestris]|nr:hypothetical protein CRUP_020730 [Coryphaenoides rupestris]
MRALILCCLVALADLSLDPKKTYEYKYVGQVNFGRGLPNLAESGVRLTCKVKIFGASAHAFMLQVSDLAFEEFNGFPGKNAFNGAPEAGRHSFSAQLARPFAFEFAGGHVGDIQAPTGTSDTVVNILGLHGLCQSNYAVEEAADTEMIITQKGDSIVSTVKYVYTLKPSAAGAVISKAHALELQHFSPFNVKGGSFKMQATKELLLLGVTDTATVLPLGPMLPKGNIVYKFVNNPANLPIMMQNLDNPIPKVNDARILRFLELRFKAGDLSPIEAWQTLLLAFNHLQATPELVETAKEFLTIPFSKSDQFVWHTVMLAYGSLVYKHCSYYTPCPVTAVQPLLDMAVDSLKRVNEEDMLLALKALGNAGHPASIKTIMRFLPGVAANPVALPARVQSAAVQALRLIATRDPHSVRRTPPPKHTHTHTHTSPPPP